jgi:hypothetical protein
MKTYLLTKTNFKDQVPIVIGQFDSMTKAMEFIYVNDPTFDMKSYIYTVEEATVQ